MRAVIVISLLLFSCSPPQIGRMTSPDYSEQDWSDARLTVLPLPDSVVVLAHGVSVFVFEYLEYDERNETAAQALKRTFYHYFLPAVRENTRLTVTEFDSSFDLPLLSKKKSFVYDVGDTVTLVLPRQDFGADNDAYPDTEFLLLIENLSFDVREKTFSGRNRRVYLRVNFDYAIWDRQNGRVAKFGKVRLSEPASFAVANGTFKSTFSERTWSKTLSKAAESLFQNTPFTN